MYGLVRKGILYAYYKEKDKRRRERAKIKGEWIKTLLTRNKRISSSENNIAVDEFEICQK